MSKPGSEGERAAIYVRISSVPDAEKRRPGERSHGVQRQERDCRAEAKRLGWTVVGLYRDDDKSAFSGRRRPDYERLCDDLKSGVVDAVIVWHPDRLHRSPKELEAFIDLIEATGAAVATVVAGTYDLTTPAGRMTARVVGSTARYESEHKSERLRRKHLEIVESGMPNGGRCPFGYRRVGLKVDPAAGGADTRELVPEPAEAAVVAEVVGRIAAGETLGAIAHDLNQRAVPTAQGGEWRLETIRSRAVSATVIGRRMHRGVDVGPANWPAIVDEATWRRANTIITARQETPEQTQRRTARKYLLAGGLVVCGRCGAWLRGKPKEDGRSIYACPSKRLGGCNGLGIKAPELEALVTEAVIRRVESAEFGRSLRRRAQGGRGQVSDVAAIEARLDQLADAFSAGALTMREWQRAREGLDARLEVARSQLASDTTTAVVGRHAGRAGSLRDSWADMTLDRRQAVVRAVVDNVTIAPARRGVRPAFDADRVAVAWRA
jgi:DNA invertase Pin-like site-specific DNA recombinase